MLEGVQLFGLVIFIFGGIAFLVAAFKTNLFWGLGCILIAPVSILYLVFHWGDAKKPFSIQVIGLVIVVASAYARQAYRY
jgi:hypothetical protein